MSDTEEVVIPRSNRRDADANRTQPKVNTKPEIAREKLKEKRERLKKEKENALIEEAKKRLASESEKKQQEEVLAKQQEEENKKKDPSYNLLMKMEQMMAMMAERHAPIAPGPIDKARGRKKTVIPKKEELKEEEEEPEIVEKPKRKPRVPKEIVDKPNKSKGLPKPRKKVVYLQQAEPVQEESTKFIGYDIAPPQEPIQYQPSSGLLSAMMGRRNMNSFQY
jgi:hypothetical protein